MSSDQRRVRDPEGARRTLVQAGLRLFVQKGYAGTSVQSIVDAAGLTKGAFYHHFDSKDALLLKMHDEFIDYEIERAREVMDVPGLAQDERLRRLIIESLIEPMAIFSEEMTVFLSERRFLPDEMFADVIRRREEYEDFFVKVIDDGMREGVFRKIGPPRIVAFGILGMGASTPAWLDVSGPLSTREIGEVFATMAVDGLRSSQ